MHMDSSGQRIEVTQHVVHAEAPDHLNRSSETLLCQVLEHLRDGKCPVGRETNRT